MFYNHPDVEHLGKDFWKAGAINSFINLILSDHDDHPDPRMIGRKGSDQKWLGSISQILRALVQSQEWE